MLRKKMKHHSPAHSSGILHNRLAVLTEEGKPCYRSYDNATRFC